MRKIRQEGIYLLFEEWGNWCDRLIELQWMSQQLNVIFIFDRHIISRSILAFNPDLYKQFKKGKHSLPVWTSNPMSIITKRGTSRSSWWVFLSLSEVKVESESPTSFPDMSITSLISVLIPQSAFSLAKNMWPSTIKSWSYKSGTQQVNKDLEPWTKHSIKTPSEPWSSSTSQIATPSTT